MEAIVDDVPDGRPSTYSVLLLEVLEGFLKGGHVLFPVPPVTSRGNVDARPTWRLGAVQLAG